MSGSHVRGWLASVLALSSLGLVWVAARADGPEDDLLEQVRKQQQVSAQKLEADVKGVLHESIAQAKTQPARTAELLRFFLTQIADAPGLTADKRGNLQRQVRARLAEVEESARAQAAAQDRAAKESADKGRYRPTGAEERNPPVSGSYKAAVDRFKSANQQVAGTNRFKSDRDRGFAGALNNVASSSVPPDRDLTFSKDWNKIVANRKIGPKLTERELALVKALNSILSVDYKNAKFREVIEDLAERTKQTIVMDKDSLREAMVEYDTPVSLKLDKVSVRSVLKKILSDNGLSYIVKDGILQVVSEQKARNTLSVRVYPVSDIVAAANPFSSPLMSNLQMYQNAANLIAMIQSTIDPPSWQANGGNGTIFFHAPTMSLVVRQTSEFHLTYGFSLAK